MSEAKTADFGVSLGLSLVALAVWFISKQMIPFTEDFRFFIMFAASVFAGAVYMWKGKDDFGLYVAIFLFVSFWTAIGKINTLSAETFICWAILAFVLAGINYAKTKGWMIGTITVIMAIILAPFACQVAITIIMSGGNPLPIW